MTLMVRLRCWCILRYIVALLVAVPTGAAHAESSAAASVPSEVPLADLQRIGKEIAESVLKKDAEGVVRYGRPDYVDSDRAELQRPGSELYCYVFDTSCNFRGRPSVYAVLQKAKRLAVEAVYLGEGRSRPNATIVFYDATKATKSALGSRAYLASNFGKELFTWRFEYVDGRWRAVTPPFNAFTDL